MNNDLKQLIAKFKHIGFLNYKQVIEELKQHNSITDKLNYLKTLKEKYYDEFEKVQESLNNINYTLLLTGDNHSIILNSVFGEVNLITPLSIQEPVFKKYFENGLNTPEFTYWFLKYQANDLFNYLTNKEDFKSNLNSVKLRETFIQSELKVIEDEKIKTKELFLNKKIGVYDKSRNDYYNRKERSILRILDGNYFKNNALHDVFAIGVEEVNAYYKHILLKPFLISQLKNRLQQKDESKHELSLKQIALINIYNENQIIRSNADKIARENKFTSKNSGEKLYQNFNKYYSVTDRKGDEGTKRKTNIKIKLIESIIDLLPNHKQDRAKDEVLILKNTVKSNY